MERTNRTQLRWVVPLAVLPILFSAGQASPDPPIGVPPNLLDQGAFNSSGLTLDDAYALGRSIYSGRYRKRRGVEVCLNMSRGSDEPPSAAEPSRDVLKLFVGVPILVLTTRLVDCNEPKSQLALVLSRNEFRALVYFMNKRFHLRLES